MGMRPENIMLCDTKGVVYRGRTEGMNQWKSAHAVQTDRRSLAQALEGCDVFFGLSVKGALTPQMLRSMAPNPIIFAMANPDPEITPEEAKAARPDCIIATGRSDYPNQVNNVLGFPFIFRGALDVRARTINDAMKVAAAEALAQLAREEVPEEVARSGAGKRLIFGPEYIIPNAFDPRLISRVPAAVALAAMQSGVAQKPLTDHARYVRDLTGRLDAAANALENIHDGNKFLNREFKVGADDDGGFRLVGFERDEAGFEVSGCDNRIIDLEYVVFINRDIECLRRIGCADRRRTFWHDKIHAVLNQGSGNHKND
jgi:malate dehydrogenase (oxaloacetate-decarboxylating)(NADP+)